ncbi:hypothetical protein BK670_05540 [Pseudomonas fluorescens]|uniref:Uncharacterized protein n=1 Tax=Pseudomonas fluorescens TaxID=294 RepID=A0A423MLB4_PSEFL|nr:hypothetical protein BK670_05540 [Pseudomonas fluorescens]
MQAVVLLHGPADVFLGADDLGIFITPSLAALRGDCQALFGAGLAAFELTQFIGDLDDAIVCCRRWLPIVLEWRSR